jgi:hypothetical protein
MFEFADLSAYGQLDKIGNRGLYRVAADSRWRWLS